MEQPKTQVPGVPKQTFDAAAVADIKRHCTILLNSTRLQKSDAMERDLCATIAISIHARQVKVRFRRMTSGDAADVVYNAFYSAHIPERLQKNQKASRSHNDWRWTTGPLLKSLQWHIKHKGDKHSTLWKEIQADAGWKAEVEAMMALQRLQCSMDEAKKLGLVE